MNLLPVAGFILCWPAALASQLETNAPWPMYRQNLRHTGWSNDRIPGVQKDPYVKWSFTTGDEIYSSPAVSPDGTIYIGSDDGCLYALKNGAALWSYYTTNAVTSSPALGKNGEVIFGSLNGKLYALTNGKVKWCFNTGGGIDCSPAVGKDGTVYIGSTDHKLYAVTNGVLKWSVTTAGAIERSSPALGRDGTVYIASLDTFLYAVTNGAVKWTCPVGNWCYSSPAIGPDNTVYIGGESDHRIYAVTNGAVKWSYLTGDILLASPAIGSNNVIYMGSADGFLYAMTNGKIKWAYNANTGSGMDIYSSPVLGPDETVYFGALYPFVGEWYGEVFAVKDGVKKWSFRLPHWIYTSAPAIDPEGNIVVGCIDHKVYCIGQTPEPSSLTNHEAGALSRPLDRIIAAPNPFRSLNSVNGDFIDFFNLPDGFRLTVLSIRGQKVFETAGPSGNGRYRWALRDREGNAVPSGVYLCRITDPSGTVKELKIVIIR